MDYLQIDPRDNVAVALRAGLAVPEGHKIALRAIACGEPVIKYGSVIGYACAAIAKGEWVHSHNLKTALEGTLSYAYRPVPTAPVGSQTGFFQGYLRPDGQAGVRNEIWILPLVGCVNAVCEQLAVMARDAWVRTGAVDAVVALTHPYGCSQLGGDMENTQKILAGLIRNPNAAGALVVGLGCENNRMEAFHPVLGATDPDRVQFLNCQDEPDELQAGMERLGRLAAWAGKQRRQRLPVSLLRVGLKCGGSDGFSGVTANPAVGAFCDRLIAQGGTGVLTEVPEMFGAEQALMDRCASQDLFSRTVWLINSYKRYFLDHGQVVYENPSPGNRDGGITTLEEKSLGCTQKSGHGPITGVLDYGERAEAPGVSLLWGPGNDLVACTALAAAGCQLILFTTGRGTPLGAPVPTVKIATHSALARNKRNWIDFDAGPMLEGASLDETAQSLYRFVLETANGRRTKSEVQGFRQTAIFKDGVTL